jgi:hypothetical protein
MAANKIYAIYTDDDLLLDAVKKTVAEDYHISEVYTPFPVHGLDPAMGTPPTRLAITSFLYGLVGLAVATWMMNYMMIVDWPQNIGGKPSFSFHQNLPAFIPIMFEMTVFFAGHLMVITFYLRSRLWPFKKAENPDPRTTDDMFMMEVDIDNHDIDMLTEFFISTGAAEISFNTNEEDR